MNAKDILSDLKSGEVAIQGKGLKVESVGIIAIQGGEGIPGGVARGIGSKDPDAIEISRESVIVLDVETEGDDLYDAVTREGDAEVD